MWKKILAAFLFIAALSYADSPTHGTIPTPSGATFVWDNVNKVWRAIDGDAVGGSNVTVDKNAGAYDIATPTISVNAASPTSVGTLPSGTRGLLINAFGGDILLGHLNDLASGTFFVGVKIASGTSLSWTSISTTTPNLWLLSNSGSAATATIVAW